MPRLKTLAESVINKGNNLLTANIPPKMKLNSVSKKLFVGKILILEDQISVPAPTNKSFPKKPIKILRNDSKIKTNKIIFPDSATLNVK